MPAKGKILANPIIASETEDIFIWALVVEVENDNANPYKPITGLAGKDLVAKIYKGNILIATVALDKEADAGFYFNSETITLRNGIYGVYLKHSPTDYTGFTTIHVSPAHTNAESYLNATISSRASQSSVNAIKAKTDNLPSDPASQSQVESAINHAEAIIRGADNDDLKTISDQLDSIQADLDNPDQYKADVSALALESTVQAIKAKTDNLTFSGTNIQARINDSGVLDIPTVEEIDNQLSATHGSGIWEGTTPSGIWNYSNRSLTEPVDISDTSKDEIIDGIWDEPISEHITSGTFGAKNQNKVPSENIDDYKADISNLALESTAQAIKAKTDNLTFSGTDIQARINDSGVLDIPTVEEIDNQLSSTHGSGSWEGTTGSGTCDPADIWSYPNRTLTSLSGQPVIDIDEYLSNIHGSGTWEPADTSNLAKESTLQAVKDQTDRMQFDTSNFIKSIAQNPELNNLDTTISSRASQSTVNDIKSKTDKLQFTADNDVKATLDGEKVSLTDETEQQIDNIENNVTNPDQYKADVSALALENTVQSIKSKTDKLTFDENNNIEARINDSGVLNVPSVEDIDNRLSNTHGFGSWEGVTASGVWNYLNRSLTEPVDISDTSKNAIIDGVWDEPITDHVTANTFGAKNQNKVPSENIADYRADVSDLALESTAQAIKNKTDNLPSDPASQSQVESAINTAEANIRGADNDDLKVLSDQLDSVKGDTNAIKAQTNRIQFDANNNIEARINDSGVLDVPTVEEIDIQLSSTHGSGIWEAITASGIWNYPNRTLTSPVDITNTSKDAIVDGVWDESISEHTIPDTFGAKNQKLIPSENIDDYKADVSNLALESSVQAIKSQTDKLKFNTDDDVIATLDGEKVNLTDITEAQIDNIEANVTNPDQYKANVSGLALESTVQSIKSKTDKLTFDENNYVKSIAQNSGLLNLDVPVSSRASQDSVDAIPTNPLLDDDPRLDNLDVPISTRSSHTPADVWNHVTRTLTSLSGQPVIDIDERLSNIHGSGSWEGVGGSGTCDPADIWNYPNRTLTSLSGQPVIDIDDHLSNVHGSGLWEGSGGSVSGTCDPADIWNYPNRTLTSLSGQPVVDIDNYLSNIHGSGNWESIDTSDLAKESTLQAVKDQTDKIQFNASNFIKSIAQNPELANLDETVSSRASQSSVDAIPTNPLLENDPRLPLIGEHVAKEETLQEVKSKTDNLPSDPASQSQVENAINTAESNIRGADDDDLKILSDQLDNIQADLDNPDQYKANVSGLALQDTLLTVKSQTDKLQFNDNNYVKSEAQNPELSNLDIAVSTRASQDSVNSIINTLSTLVSDIWNYSTRTLTSFGSLISDIWNYVTRSLTEKVSINDSDKEDIVDKVWDEPLSEHTASGTFGATNQKAVPSENIDDYKADVSALAKESTLQEVKSQTDKLHFDNEYVLSSPQTPVEVSDQSINNINQVLSSHHGSGNWEGQEVNCSVDPSGVAKAVWDEPTYLHYISGTFGKLLQDIDFQIALNGDGIITVENIFPVYLTVLSTIPPSSQIVDSAYGTISGSQVIVKDGINVIFNYPVNGGSTIGRVHVIKSHVYYYDNTAVNVDVNVLGDRIIIKNLSEGFVFDFGYLYEIRLTAGINSAVSGVYPMQDDYVFYLLPYSNVFDVNADVIKMGLSSFVKNYTDFAVMLMYMRNLYYLYENIKAVKPDIELEDLTQLAICMTRYTFVTEILSKYLDSMGIRKTLGDFTVSKSLAARIDSSFATIVDSIISCIENEMAALKLNIKNVIVRGSDYRFPQKLRTQFFFEEDYGDSERSI